MGSETAGPQAPVRATLALALTRPVAGRLALATLLGAGALGAGIGLMATSAWLISRASQRPPESALAIAIVAVQLFGLSRGLFRYEQRLVGHDSAFRSLAALRVRSYERLETLAPAGLAAFRSADLLARVVHDIDSLQDVLLRVIPAFAIALIVGAGTVGLMWWILPAAGLILLAALMLTATALTWLTGRLARRSEGEQTAIRGEMTVAVVDMLYGAPELTAYGAVGAQRRRIAASEARLVRAVSSAARTAGVGQGVAILFSGLAMWGGLLVGVAAVRGGVLDGVLLAVIALVPLAAFELGADLPAAAQTLQRVRRSAARTIEVLEAVPPVAEPVHPRRMRPVAIGPHNLRVRGLHARYGPGSPWVLDGLDLDLMSGQSVAVVGNSGAGKSTLANVLLRFLPYEGGSITLDGTPVSELAGDDYRQVVGSCPRTHTSSTRRSRRTCASPAVTRPRRSCSTLWTKRGCWSGSQVCRLDWTRGSVPTGRRSPAVNASGSRSRGRCWRISRCSSSTSPENTLTSTPPTRSWPICWTRAHRGPRC